MQPILANYTASITELKKLPTQLIEDAGDEAVGDLIMLVKFDVKYERSKTIV